MLNPLIPVIPKKVYCFNCNDILGGRCAKRVYLTYIEDRKSFFKKFLVTQEVSELPEKKHH